MRKAVSFLLVLSMALLALASCGTASATGTTATTQGTNGGTTTSATTATTAKPQDPPAAPPALVFHFDFSEENAQNGVLKDVSGNGHDGKIHGSLAFENGSARFTGDGASYITVPDHEDMNFTRKQSFTLEIKFKAEPASSWSCIAQKGLGDGKPAYFGFWLSDGNKLNMGIGSSGKKNFASDSEVGSEWHHAIIIQDVKAGTVLFYLDGELQSSTFPKSSKVPVTPTKVASAGEDFTIGTNFSEHFTGLIDDIKLYNYAVPESELLADYPGLVFSLERGYYDYSNEEAGEQFTLPYRIYRPTGYTENNGAKYPVVLLLHGHGECGKDNVGHLRNSGGHIEGLMARDDCIVIAPQCQCDLGINREWVASKHNFAYTNRTLPEKATLALRALMALMDEIAKDPKVDANKISAFGFSMGGFGVWELLMRKPDMFSAAVIFSAAGAPASADKVLDIDIRAYHGMKDTTVPPSGLTLMDEAITALGGTKFKASYFEDADHNTCGGYAFEQDGDLFAWLLEQTNAD